MCLGSKYGWYSSTIKFCDMQLIRNLTDYFVRRNIIIKNEYSTETKFENDDGANTMNQYKPHRKLCIRKKI